MDSSSDVQQVPLPYRVAIGSNIAALQQQINDLVAQGYEPTGSIAFTDGLTPYVCLMQHHTHVYDHAAALRVAGQAHLPDPAQVELLAAAQEMVKAVERDEEEVPIDMGLFALDVLDRLRAAIAQARG
jgi:hypothetical protein